MSREEELLEVIGWLASIMALVERDGEGLTSEPIEAPLSEQAQRDLRQRDAFVETFRRLHDGAKVTKAQLRKVFEEELGKVDRVDVTEVAIPMMPETKQALAEAWELLRRRALADPDLGDVLKPVEFGCASW